MRHSIRGVVAIIITAILLTIFLSSCSTPNYRVTGAEVDPVTQDTIFFDAVLKSTEEKIREEFAKQNKQNILYLRVDEWKDAKQLRGRKVLEYKRSRDE